MLGGSENGGVDNLGGQLGGECAAEQLLVFCAAAHQDLLHRHHVVPALACIGHSAALSAASTNPACAPVNRSSWELLNIGCAQRIQPMVEW